MKLAPVFERLLQGWRQQGYELVGLGGLLASAPDKNLPRHEVVDRRAARDAPARWRCRGRRSWPRLPDTAVLEAARAAKRLRMLGDTACWKTSAVPDFERRPPAARPSASRPRAATRSSSTSIRRTTPRAAPTRAAQFRDLHAEFQKLGVRGLRRLARQRRVPREASRPKMSFPFELLSDADESAVPDVRRDQDEEHVRQEGARHRAQHLRDRRDGRIAREWRGVKVPGHAQEVLDFVKTLKLDVR